MRHRAGELDMTHALAADSSTSDLDAALIADDPSASNLLVLTAIALPILSGAKDGLTEQTVFFRPEAPVVYGLRLRHFAV